MKKKILSVLATMFLGSALTLGFSACKGDDSNEDILSSVHSEQSESVGGGNNTSDGGNSGDGNIEEEGSSDGASSHEHSYTAVITEPTCLVGGYTTYTCACGNTYQADYVDALEHLNEGGYCSRCDTGETHSSYFTFTLLADDTYIITAKDGNNIPNNIKLPSEYEGKKVTAIGEGAFTECGNLTSVKIPDSVTSIGSYVFGACSSLTSVVIPDSVTSIGDVAFYNCDSLTSITVGENNTVYQSIDGNLYSKDGSVLIRYAIGKTATEFVIPDSVTMIAGGAFYDCSSLTSVVIPDSVTTIGDYAFSYCYSLTSVVIPDSVTTIGDDAFFSCSSLTSVVIGNGVMEIGFGAFAFCNSLTSVEFGDSVASIASFPFSSCPKLAKIKVSENNTAYQSIDGNLYSKDGSVLIQYAIGKTATEFVIPDSVTTIGSYAFRNCDSLTSVVIGDSVTSIDSEAFYSCDSLTSVEIPDSVTSIGESAFSSCDSLTSVVIPDSVTSIGNSAFASCSSLTIYCEVESKPIEWDYSWSDYNSAVVWDCNNNDVATDGYIYVIVDGLRYRIKDGEATVARQPRNLMMVNIPESITYKDVEYCVISIGSSAFRDCSSLTSVEIPDSVTTIGEYAFNSCSSLTSITVGENNTAYQSIDGNLYSKDGSVLIQYAIGETATEFVIPECVTTIGNSAFSSCSRLTSVEIPDSVTSIGGGAFSNCSSLTSVVIGDSVTTIGHYAFSYCDSLTSVVIPDSVTTIGFCAFLDCSSLTSVVIGDSVTSIVWGAFSYCSSLTSVVIPGSVTSIGEGTFSNCKSLTIYCEAESQPSGWDADWNSSNRPVYWGWKEEN